MCGEFSGALDGSPVDRPKLRRTRGTPMTAENIVPKARKDGGQATPALDVQSQNFERQQRETQNARVAQQVLCALGKPENLLTVQVRPLWEGNYRVNVFVGSDIVFARIAYSYFVVADAAGNVLEASPAINQCV
jgi:hypothetical protein